ncbi:hypothetical protein NITLEN_10153 [Nitrospira lenta]|uniref:Uncharacterized protein n=1 Tax=Nitrospira lenta TaxID=1436998 RepID=A0A330L154_9BACT|nr:hypothetical protein NITLEN_10153 [Nitrospira lenta]
MTTRSTFSPRAIFAISTSGAPSNTIRFTAIPIATYRLDRLLLIYQQGQCHWIEKDMPRLTRIETTACSPLAITRLPPLHNSLARGGGLLQCRSPSWGRRQQLLFPVKSDGRRPKSSLGAKPFCPLCFHLTFLFRNLKYRNGIGLAAPLK